MEESSANFQTLVNYYNQFGATDDFTIALPTFVAQNILKCQNIVKFIDKCSKRSKTLLQYWNGSKNYQGSDRILVLVKVYMVNSSIYQLFCDFDKPVIGEFFSPDSDLRTHFNDILQFMESLLSEDLSGIAINTETADIGLLYMSASQQLNQQKQIIEEVKEISPVKEISDAAEENYEIIQDEPMIQHEQSDQMKEELKEPELCIKKQSNIEIQLPEQVIECHQDINNPIAEKNSPKQLITSPTSIPNIAQFLTNYPTSPNEQDKTQLLIQIFSNLKNFSKKMEKFAGQNSDFNISQKWLALKGKPNKIQSLLENNFAVQEILSVIEFTCDLDIFEFSKNVFSNVEESTENVQEEIILSHIDQSVVQNDDILVDIIEDEVVYEQVEQKSVLSGESSHQSNQNEILQVETEKLEAENDQQDLQQKEISIQEKSSIEEVIESDLAEIQPQNVPSNQPNQNSQDNFEAKLAEQQQKIKKGFNNFTKKFVDFTDKISQKTDQIINNIVESEQEYQQQIYDFDAILILENLVFYYKNIPLDNLYCSCLFYLLATQITRDIPFTQYTQIVQQEIPNSLLSKYLLELKKYTFLTTNLSKAEFIIQQYISHQQVQSLASELLIPSILTILPNSNLIRGNFQTLISCLDQVYEYDFTNFSQIEHDFHSFNEKISAKKLQLQREIQSRYGVDFEGESEQVVFVREVEAVEMEFGGGFKGIELVEESDEEGSGERDEEGGNDVQKGENEVKETEIDRNNAQQDELEENGENQNFQQESVKEISRSQSSVNRRETTSQNEQSESVESSVSGQQSTIAQIGVIKGLQPVGSVPKYNGQNTPIFLRKVENLIVEEPVIRSKLVYQNTTIYSPFPTGQMNAIQQKKSNYKISIPYITNISQVPPPQMTGTFQYQTLIRDKKLLLALQFLSHKTTEVLTYDRNTLTFDIVNNQLNLDFKDIEKEQEIVSKQIKECLPWVEVSCACGRGLQKGVQMCKCGRINCGCKGLCGCE